MICTDELTLVGSGTCRRVYLHPQDDSKVLKVYRKSRTPERTRARKWHRRVVPCRKYDINRKQFDHYRRIKRKAPEFLDSVPAVFGYVETDRGSALVVECIRNPDGSICESLRDYVAANGLGEVTELLDAFFARLDGLHIVVNDVNPGNFLVRRTEDGLKLVLIDGFGDPALVSLRAISRRRNLRKLMKKKQRLFEKLQRLTEDEPIPARLK